jgi:hypothetical protein
MSLVHRVDPPRARRSPHAAAHSQPVWGGESTDTRLRSWSRRSPCTQTGERRGTAVSTIEPPAAHCCTHIVSPSGRCAGWEQCQQARHGGRGTHMVETWNALGVVCGGAVCGCGVRASSWSRTAQRPLFALPQSETARAFDPPEGAESRRLASARAQSHTSQRACAAEHPSNTTRQVRSNAGVQLCMIMFDGAACSQLFGVSLVQLRVRRCRDLRTHVSVRRQLFGRWSAGGCRCAGDRGVIRLRDAGRDVRTDRLR